MITKEILNKLEERKDFEVFIGDITFKVKFDKGHCETAEVLGHFNSSLQLIYLHPDLDISKIRNIFLHEVMHRIFHTSGLTFENQLGEMEESLCRVLAEHINLFEIMNK